jgi:MtaA/CmuA family methyltransferase
MTPKQRYFAVIRGETPDMLPRVPILMQFAAEYIGSNYGQFAADHKTLVEANIRCAEDFGFDQLSTISDPYRETAGFGAEIRYHPNGVPECVRPPLADLDTEPEALAALKVPDPNEKTRMKDRIDAIRLYRERTGDHYSILGWVEGPAALACDLRGMSEMLMDLMEEPEWCGTLMDLCVETSLAFALAQLEAGADTIGIGDAVCSQISPDIYDSLVWPRQRKLMEGIRSAGGLVRVHICGQTRHLWPKLRELPIDIIDCDHMVDMRVARQTFPSQVVLAGNLDPVSLLRFGTPESITREVKACYEASGSRYMVGAGCEIPSRTPNENLKALCAPLAP